MKGKAFFICPVRGHNPAKTRATALQIDIWGWDCYWPPRDTDQDDDIGLRICEDNRKAIEEAGRVFVVWDGQSQGCLFDLGMAFALHKPLEIIEVPQLTEGKSFQNMLRAWELGQGE